MHKRGAYNQTDEHGYGVIEAGRYRLSADSAEKRFEADPFLCLKSSVFFEKSVAQRRA